MAAGETLSRLLFAMTLLIMQLWCSGQLPKCAQRLHKSLPERTLRLFFCNFSMAMRFYPGPMS